MTYFQYIRYYLLSEWIQRWTFGFRYWADLMTGDWDDYTLSEEDDPYQECSEWFWEYLNCEDDILPKKFFDKLYSGLTSQEIADYNSANESPFDIFRR